MRVVIDTNVFVSALKSNLGTSYQVLKLVGTGAFQHVLTVPLLMEYEDVLKRPHLIPISAHHIDAVLDYLCVSAEVCKVHYLWRPRLNDVKDDMVLEAAANGRCSSIVTWNTRDFAQARSLGIRALTPTEFLQVLNK